MYYLVFLVGAILSIFNEKRKISFKKFTIEIDDRKKISFLLFTIILLILAIFRYGVGADYFSYNHLYNNLNKSVILELTHGSNKQEILFRLIGSALKKIGFSYQQYLAVIAMINIYFIYKTCKYYSKNPTFSMLIYYSFYYFVWTFSGLRQGIALAVGMYYLLECIENNNTKKMILITILLSLIHLSAIILIPLYFSSKIDINKRKLIFLLCIGISISIIPLGNIIQKLDWLPFRNRVMPYITTHDFSIRNVLDFKSLGRIFFLLIGFFNYDAYLNQDYKSKCIINVYMLSLIFYFYMKFSEITAARLSVYGFFLSIIILPNIFYIYKDKLRKRIYLACLIILCVLYFNKELYAMQQQSELINTNTIIIPYTNIFKKEEYMFIKKYRYLRKHYYNK